MIAAVIAALVARLAAALTGIPVSTGTPIISGAELELVLVGDDADPTSEAESAEVQEWANIAASARDCRGTIPGAVIVQSGDTDPSVQLARADAILALIGAVMRADVSLGGLVFTAEFTGRTARILQNEQGAAALAPFTISYYGQI